jgi:hypothetical protein
MQVSFVKTLKLNGTSGVDALADDGGDLVGIFARQFLIAKRRHVDLNIDAVK